MELRHLVAGLREGLDGLDLWFPRQGRLRGRAEWCLPAPVPRPCPGLSAGK